MRILAAITTLILFIFAGVAAAAIPAVPLGLAMVANSPDSITLSWYSSPNNDATAYNVYTSATKDGEFTRFATVKERTATHKKPANCRRLPAPCGLSVNYS